LAARFETCASHQHLRCCMLSLSLDRRRAALLKLLKHRATSPLAMASTNKLLRAPRRTFSSHLSRPHATRGHIEFDSQSRRGLRQACAARHGHAWLQDPSEFGALGTTTYAAWRSVTEDGMERCSPPSYTTACLIIRLSRCDLTLSALLSTCRCRGAWARC
jgi:hypothetical protein